MEEEFLHLYTPLSRPLSLSGLQEVYPHKDLRQHLAHSCFSAFSSSHHPCGDHLGCLLRSSTLSWSSVYSPIAWTTQGSSPTCNFPCAWHRHSNVSRPLQCVGSLGPQPHGEATGALQPLAPKAALPLSAWSPAPFLLTCRPWPSCDSADDI